MNANQEKVVTWIRSGMNYNDGINLLGILSNKKIIADQFYGKERSMAGKLAYEILKASSLADHITWKQFIQNVKDAPIPTKLVKTETDKSELKSKSVPGQSADIPAINLPDTIDTNPGEEYPAIIRRVIYEYAELFQERSKMHAVMSAMPESNAESVCAKRAELLSVINSITDRMEMLYVARADFKSRGILPDVNKLFPREDQKPDETATVELTEDALKKQKKNLQSSNSKDQTLLDYQAKKSEGFKNPMPNGPKRIKIETRIKERNAKIEEIEMQLLKATSAATE